MFILAALILATLIKVEDRLLHEGTVIEVVEELCETEEGARIVFILGVYRGVFFHESIVSYVVIQPPLFLVGEHLVG